MAILSSFASELLSVLQNCEATHRRTISAPKAKTVTPSIIRNLFTAPSYLTDFMIVSLARVRNLLFFVNKVPIVYHRIHFRTITEFLFLEDRNKIPFIWEEI